MTTDNKVLKDILSRLERLERTVFDARKKTTNKPTSNNLKRHKGATGGIRLLADNGFFNKKRSFGEIYKALENKGYHYTKQAVQTPLNNLSASSGSPLVSLSEKGHKLYAIRK
jgi:hypothetical protein